jgi:alpha-tubulin suppressor-like RCC1 family protein
MIASSSSKLLKLSPPLRTFSTLYTWGDYSGGLGQGEHTPTLLQSYGIPQKVMTNVSQVSMGKDHSALITTDGQLMTTGSGEAYQLGNSQ